MFSIHTVTVGQMGVNCYLLEDSVSHEMLIVDPGDASDHISDVIQRLGGIPQAVVATHGHFDHILAAFALTNIYNIPFFMNQKDDFLVATMQSSAKHFLGLDYVDPPPTRSNTLKEGEVISFGATKIHVMETPGHTPGSISLVDQESGNIFVGDVVFKGGGVGRTDFSYARPDDLYASIKKILAFDPTMHIYAGHGEPTTIGEEKVLIESKF